MESAGSVDTPHQRDVEEDRLTTSAYDSGVAADGVSDLTAEERSSAVQVTIGLPVYNGERYLSEALDSILGQTFRDFVLVVSDNASSDRTVEIVESYAALDDRVVVLRSPANRGAAWNFNRTFEVCRSPYFKWAAADDLMAPTCVERCLDTLTQAPPSVVLAYPRTRLIDDEGREIGELVDKLATAPDAPVHARLRHVVANAVYGNLAFALMRSEALRRTRLHGSFPSSDYVLLAELALVGAFVEVPEYLFLRRDHADASRRANVSLEEISAWFDPFGPAVRHERVRLFREHLAGISHADLPPATRLAAYSTFLSTWVRRITQVRTRVRRALSRVRR
jgi:glycosyltransferase involved in cell wall biosynthesis